MKIPVVSYSRVSMVDHRQHHEEARPNADFTTLCEVVVPWTFGDDESITPTCTKQWTKTFKILTGSGFSWQEQRLCDCMMWFRWFCVVLCTLHILDFDF